MKKIYERVKTVREFRLKSIDSQTRKDADTPTLFQKIRQYVPIRFMTPETVVSEPTTVQAQAIELAAQKILDALAKYEGATLADMYDAWQCRWSLGGLTRKTIGRYFWRTGSAKN